MLGRALVEKLSENHEIIGLSRRDKFNAAVCLKTFISADIVDRSTMREVILEHNPEIVIHAAALSDVDRCEKEPRLARQINVAGTENVALASLENNSLFVYVSTDYVFDGKSKKPYREIDVPSPVNVYGKTKLEGEGKVKGILKKYLIIRTAWLFGPGGDSFVESIKRRTGCEKILNIVNDKFSSPTYTKDLAQAIDKLIEIVSGNSKVADIYGVYHITNSGQASWFTWAKEILKNIKAEGAKVKPISLKELKLAAPRPEMTVLDNSRYIKLTNQPLRSWQEALEDYLTSR